MLIKAHYLTAKLGHSIIVVLIWAQAPTGLFAQNYFQYQQTFNLIDNDINSGNLNTALNRCDSIFNHYSFIYARHCIKALQIACKARDSIRANQYLIKAFKQGVPQWIIHSNRLTKKCLQYANCRQTLSDYNNLHHIYLSTIDTSLAKKIDSLYRIDQKLTNLVNNAFFPLRYTYHYYRWRRNNKKQFKVIKQIIQDKGFPGERLIGLPPAYFDSTSTAGNINFYGPDIFDYRAYFMLIHFYSNKGESIEDKLYLEAKKGYLPPKHFASIMDFVSTYGKGKSKYYNNWHNDPNKENLSLIRKRRKAIGLKTIEAQNATTLFLRNQRKLNKISNTILRE